MNISVQLVDTENLAWVRHTIETDHYLHRWPDPRSLPFAYVLFIKQLWGDHPIHADGRPYGVVVMKKPQHHKQAGLFGYPGLPTAWQVLDLARVWVHPALQFTLDNGHAACVFSQMVSLVLRRVQADWLTIHPPRFPDQPYHIETIISYCELAHHDGTAYRASGFTRHGLSTDSSKEVYIRHLRRPRRSWSMPAAQIAQMPLFNGMPIRYE